MIKNDLKATLKDLGGNKFRLTCEELGISVDSCAPSPELCRKIMQAHPDRARCRVRVFRGEMECYVIREVASLAKKSFVENDAGIHLVKYRPFPGKEIFEKN